MALFTIVHECRFERDAHEHFGSTQDLDEALAGADIILARSPHADPLLPGTSLRRAGLNGRDAGWFALFYSVDDDREEVHYERLTPMAQPA